MIETALLDEFGCMSLDRNYFVMTFLLFIKPFSSIFLEQNDFFMALVLSINFGYSEGLAEFSRFN